MERNIKRGDIYYADLNPSVGCEQAGCRPVVVIQNNTGNRYSPTLVIAPTTSRTTTKPMLPTHVRIPSGFGIERKSIILLEQIRTIDRSRLGAFVGTLSPSTMIEIDVALAVSIGLTDFLTKFNNSETSQDLQNVQEAKTSPKNTENSKIPMRTNVLELCLCSRCASHYYDIYKKHIKRSDYNQEAKDWCDFCSVHLGYDYLIITH
ncbi:MAG: type II toxin-antitoxin system PemK/MazF family toxin [Saccharofermentanales bacterium]